MEMWEECCEVDEHIFYAGIWIGPPDVSSSSGITCSFPPRSEIPDGLGEALTDAWSQ